MTEKPTSTADSQKVKSPSKKSPAKKVILGCLTVVFGFLLVVVVGGFLIFQGIKSGVDLGVTHDEADFVNFKDKIGMSLAADPSHLCFTCEVRYSGKKEADFSLTNEELSAWFDGLNSQAAVISGTQIKVEPGRASIVTNVHYQGVVYPVFASGGVQKAGSQSVKIDVDAVKLGKVPIPQSVAVRIEEALNQFANQKLAEMDNLEIEKLGLQKDKLHFKGTLPGEASSY